ncbi:hypothetical protein ABIA99_006451 [Bradyrhizobium sp. LB12.1]|uniref:hypothetical protein n=1 Tax=Bradyrhizobium sp. LB12.1 TaxID=3156327 RepID=UPI003392F292
MASEDLERFRAALQPKRRGSGRLSVRRPRWWSGARQSSFRRSLVEQARAADLVVLKRQQLDDAHPHNVDPVGAIRMERPALLVPDGVTRRTVDRILVGWKDTREAHLAAREALPFLTRASQVPIVEVCTANEQDGARGRVGDVADFLRKRGVRCEHEVRVHTAEADAG